MDALGNLGFSGNPYFQQQVQDSLGDATRAYNLTTQPAFNNAMVNSGSFGNSGVQQMNSEAQRQLQTSLGRQANDMYANNYWNDQNFNRNVYNDTFNQNQQNFQNGLNLLGLQNNINQQNLGFGTQIQNAPMDYYQGFTNSANSIGQGYGNATGTMTGVSSPLMGALGGWQLGGQIAKNVSGWNGGGMGSGGWGGGGSNPQYPDYGMASGPNGGWV